MIQTKKILKEAILICENIQSIGVFYNIFTTLLQQIIGDRLLFAV